MRPDIQRAHAGSAGATSVPPAPGPASASERGPEPASAARRALGHAPFVLAGLAVLAAGSTLLAAAWFGLCRLAYVGFVGLALRAESRREARSSGAVPGARAEAAWLAFRDVAARLMLGDALALVVLCLVTRGTLDLGGPAWLAASLVLIALGLGVKLWASASLDPGTFYWRDFFVPPEQRVHSRLGPYRWLSDPMYSLGYAHAYGFALLLGSLPGLVGAAFAQLAVLLLARLVERPHVLRLIRGGASGSGEPAAAARTRRG